MENDSAVYEVKEPELISTYLGDDFTIGENQSGKYRIYKVSPQKDIIYINLIKGTFNQDSFDNLMKNKSFKFGKHIKFTNPKLLIISGNEEKILNSVKTIANDKELCDTIQDYYNNYNFYSTIGEKKVYGKSQNLKIINDVLVLNNKNKLNTSIGNESLLTKFRDALNDILLDGLYIDAVMEFPKNVNLTLDITPAGNCTIRDVNAPIRVSSYDNNIGRVDVIINNCKLDLLSLSHHNLFAFVIDSMINYINCYEKAAIKIQNCNNLYYDTKIVVHMPNTGYVFINDDIEKYSIERPETKKYYIYDTNKDTKQYIQNINDDKALIFVKKEYYAKTKYKNLIDEYEVPSDIITALISRLEQ